MPRPTVLPRLTSLRVFAALVVVGFHLSVWDLLYLPGLASIGYVGVGFFFVLSGLVLAWGTSPELPARTFYRRRLARVWPSHLVVLAVVSVVPVVAVTRGWGEVLPNVFLVQAWWVDPRTAFAFNGVSWSLACEAFFYATFPVAVTWLRRLRRSWQWAVAAALLAGSALLGLVTPLVAYHNPLARYGEFLLGLVAGIALREGWRPRIPMTLAGTTLAVGVLVGAAVPFPLPDVVLAGPFLVVILCTARRDTEAVGGWLRSPTMVFAGEASFALYLTHETVLLNLPPVLELPAWIEVAAVLVACGAAAVALHLWVERPANRALRDRGGSIALADPERLTRTDEESPPEPPGGGT